MVKESPLFKFDIQSSLTPVFLSSHLIIPYSAIICLYSKLRAYESTTSMYPLNSPFASVAYKLVAQKIRRALHDERMLKQYRETEVLPTCKTTTLSA